MFGVKGQESAQTDVRVEMADFGPEAEIYEERVAAPLAEDGDDQPGPGLVSNLQKPGEYVGSDPRMIAGDDKNDALTGREGPKPGLDGGQHAPVKIRIDNDRDGTGLDDGLDLFPPGAQDDEGPVDRGGRHDVQDAAQDGRPPKR